MSRRAGSQRSRRTRNLCRAGKRSDLINSSRIVTKSASTRASQTPRTQPRRATERQIGDDDSASRQRMTNQEQANGRQSVRGNRPQEPPQAGRRMSVAPYDDTRYLPVDYEITLKARCSFSKFNFTSKPPTSQKKKTPSLLVSLLKASSSNERIAKNQTHRLQCRRSRCAVCLSSKMIRYGQPANPRASKKFRTGEGKLHFPDKPPFKFGQDAGVDFGRQAEYKPSGPPEPIQPRKMTETMRGRRPYITI